MGLIGASCACTDEVTPLQKPSSEQWFRAVIQAGHHATRAIDYCVGHPDVFTRESAVSQGGGAVIYCESRAGVGRERAAAAVDTFTHVTLGVGIA